MTAHRNMLHALPLPVAELALPLYRERTVAILRRYFCLAIETGRLPSLLGREFFRARSSSYRLNTFEDAVIFVHDVERCLERLDPLAQKLIAHIALQGHTADETARRLNWTRRHVARCYPEALGPSECNSAARQAAGTGLRHAPIRAGGEENSAMRDGLSRGPDCRFCRNCMKTGEI